MTAHTVDALLREASGVLSAAGVEGGRRDARLLLADLLDCAAGDLLTRGDAVVNAATADAFRARIGRRADREPVSRILGRRGFWRHEFLVGPETLDPRPDTETVVELALEALPDAEGRYSVLDLGTGTGCILLSILGDRPNATGLGIDIAPGALAVAAENARRLGVPDRARFARGDWTAAVNGKFDAIVSNPPYIPDAEVPRLDPEVSRHDPHTALKGGPDGLYPYRVIAKEAPRLLRSLGSLIVEVGAGQADDVATLFEDAHLRVIDVRRDLAGIARCVRAANG
ncbi:Protein-N(5)-glutamine methyltransferase PrmC [Caenispirillum salinarum AK4]|uniref:Release factor glutamine methyltransferase n=1 Tax=Caenispirillum salinarum AK4 TaxID=1238182 RepID=K9GJP0_9PROT|nr:peptide chain release factor N(5)-glutamine methyltransferase [Caenispirillum salinarum]EKV26170.1 Protein-N(5)-glutamine methyltransferase PrmC [Caenispirillum salinarum AK4]